MPDATTPSSLRVVDARFALPVLPRTVAVLGGLDEWRAGFDAAGVEHVPPVSADLVVAAGRDRDAALAHGRPATILVGATSRRDRARSSSRLKSLPSTSPRVLIDLEHPVAGAHAVQRLLPATGRRGALRNRTVASLLRRVPTVVPIRPDATLHLRQPGVPAMLHAFAGAGVDRSTPWCLGLSSGRTERKCAFFLFGDAEEPDRVVKFKRLPGGGEHFDAVAAGLERARTAGEAVARRAPRLLARADVDGHPVLLESAVRGVPLQRSLVAPGSETSKLELAGRIASWTTDVAVETRRANEDRPSVFEHGDLWEENVLIDGPDFSLVDWEESGSAGVPVWDLVYFSLHALPLLVGARADDDRLDAALAIARGEHRLSSVLRRWLLDYVRAIDLPIEDVAPLVAGRWRRWLDEYHSAPPEAAGWFVPRLGRAWLSTDLGTSWASSWR